MSVVTPLRFVSGVLGLWIAGRILVLTPDLLTETAEADVPANRAPRAVIRVAVPSVPVAGYFRPTDLPPAVARAVGMDPASSDPADEPAQFAAVEIGTDRDQQTQRSGPSAGSGTPRVAATALPDPSPTGIVAAPNMPPAGAVSRWSGSVYLYRRGDGDAALATGGQLGGSQAGGRIAYRLNGSGPARFAAAARIASPLDDRRGAEAAAGFDWHPLRGQPVRISVERRVDLGGAGRNAWSAYAAGGFWREPKPGFVIDGYAQAGVVGVRRRDLFADGALRTGHRRNLGGGRTLTLGGGVWAAAQPRVERVDIGPRVALGLPLAGSNASLAAEWRIRIGGDAAPRSGLAVTLASDF